MTGNSEINELRPEFSKIPVYFRRVFFVSIIGFFPTKFLTREYNFCSIDDKVIKNCQEKYLNEKNDFSLIDVTFLFESERERERIICQPGS